MTNKSNTKLLPKMFVDQEIKLIREQNRSDEKLDRDIGAFSSWILKNIYDVPESDICDQIVEPAYQHGINAFDYDPNNHVLHLIFVKIIGEDSKISRKAYMEYFLNDGITLLQQSVFRNGTKLQEIFNKLTKRKKYTIKMSMFVTTNKYSKDAEEAVAEYNKRNPHYEASIYYLNNIIDMACVPEYACMVNWNGEIRIDKCNKPRRKKMAKYGHVNGEPVTVTKLKSTVSLKTLYQFAYSAITSGYPLFRGNVRGYLGKNNDVNKRIYETLINDDERATFNILNNGITIICDGIEFKEIKGSDEQTVILKNPRIVNGCQTTSSILQAVMDKMVSPDKLEDGDVDISIITADSISDDMRATLYMDVIKGTNSQSSIVLSDFAAQEEKYKKLKEELKKFGVMLQTRQNERIDFHEALKDRNKKKRFVAKAKPLFERCGLSEEVHFRTLTDVERNLCVDTQTYVQMVISFVESGHLAFAKRSVILTDEEVAKNVADFIENATPETKATLFFLYRYANVFEGRKKNDPERSMIPWYAVDMIGKYICDRQYGALLDKFKTKEDTNIFMSKIKVATKQYMDSYKKGMQNGDYHPKHKPEEYDYSKMIKRPIDYDLLDNKWGTSNSAPVYIREKLMAEMKQS